MFVSYHSGLRHWKPSRYADWSSLLADIACILGRRTISNLHTMAGRHVPLPGNLRALLFKKKCRYSKDARLTAPDVRTGIICTGKHLSVEVPLTCVPFVMTRFGFFLHRSRFLCRCSPCAQARIGRSPTMAVTCAPPPSTPYRSRTTT